MAAEVPLMEPKHENEEPESPKETKRKKPPKKLHEFEDHGAAMEPSSKLRKIRGALLASNKPSYCLKQGVGSLQCGGESLRYQHRKRLSRLLKKLMRGHNWVEASGVLSVLLGGTPKDQSQTRNRAKYSAALELLNQIKDETIESTDKVYGLWIKKVGPLKNWTTKARFVVQLERILSCLQRGSTEEALENSRPVIQEPGFNSDPVANLVVGLTFCQKWYSNIPEELRLTKLDSSGTSMQPEVPIDGIHMPIDYSKEDDALKPGRANSRSKSNSNTSIANDKELLEESMDVDDDVKRETSHPSSQPQESSAEEFGNSDYSYLPHASIFCTQGLPPWLLPLKLPGSHENLEDAIHNHRLLQDKHYRDALKHLRVALYSTPPVIEAFHPLIQMLLLGDQVHEALYEFENVLHSSDTVLQLRLKASLLEHFDDGNYVKLYTCFEDILKKDPTCSVSLGKLVLMHKRGDYETQNLVEMIALHLDATYGTCDIWKEFTSCILKLSQCEEDRISTCGGTGRYNQQYLDSSNKVPELFTRGETGKAWRFRSRWWLNRHFHNRILMSDIKSGDLKLLTYKAAAASHIYGRHFKYVAKATECLEKENDMELYSFLQTHILNSIGFYSVKLNTS